MAQRTDERLADMVRATWPSDLAGATRTALVALYRRVADPDIQAPGKGFETLLAALPPAWCERDDTGALTGIAGLGRRETPHRISAGAVGCFGWCAWDLLFIPEILGRAIEAETRCPVTGVAVHLVIAPGELRAVTPAAAALTFAEVDGARFATDLRQAFCTQVRICAAPEGAEWYASQAPGRIALSLAQGMSLGRLRNRTVLGEPPY